MSACTFAVNPQSQVDHGPCVIILFIMVRFIFPKDADWQAVILLQCTHMCHMCVHASYYTLSACMYVDGPWSTIGMSQY